MSHSIRVEKPGKDNSLRATVWKLRTIANKSLKNLALTSEHESLFNRKMYSEISKSQNCVDIEKLRVVIKRRWFWTMANHKWSRIKGYSFRKGITLLWRGYNEWKGENQKTEENQGLLLHLRIHHYCFEIGAHTNFFPEGHPRRWEVTLSSWSCHPHSSFPCCLWHVSQGFLHPFLFHVGQLI